MPSLIEQLQGEALNPATSIADLLRKAYLVAMKLGLDDARQWIDHETNGYPPEAEVPSYRQMQGRPTYWNPFHGYQEIQFESAEEHEAFSRIHNRQPIGEIEPLLASDGDSFRCHYPPNIVMAMQRNARLPLQQVGLAIGRHHLARILDGVRNRVLVWATQLELAGVKGEGDLSFSGRDKELAAGVTYNVNMGPGSVIGAVGSVADQATVTATVNSPEVMRELASLADQVAKYAGQMGLGAQETAQLEAHAAELKQELALTAPEPTKVKRLLLSIRSLANNVAGNVIANGIVSAMTRPEIAAFLSHVLPH